MKQKDWDLYYQTNKEKWTTPDALLLEETANLSPGRALDLGAGEGADALAFAKKGWQVTALDFSPAAIEGIKAEAVLAGLEITGEVTDVLDYQPEQLFDLVYLCYFHVGEALREKVLKKAASFLAPGGTMVYVGIAKGANFETAMEDPDELLATKEEVEAALSSLHIQRCEVVHKPVEEGNKQYDSKVIVAKATKA